MKPKHNHRIAVSLSTRLILGFGLVSLGFGSQSMQAATWSGAGADANWGTTNNWDVAMANGFSAALAFGGSTQATNTNNLTGGAATSITFTAGAGAFVVGGTSITLTGAITNSSTSLQAINLPLVTTALRTVTTAASGGDITVGGVISGATGGITKAGSGTLTLSGVNTYTGTTAISAGIVKNGSATTFTTKGTLSMTGTGTLDLNGFNAAFSDFAGTSVAGDLITNNGASNATLSVNPPNNSGTFAGLIKDGTKTLAVVITGPQMNTPNCFSNGGNTFSGGLTLRNRLYISTAISTTGTAGAITASNYGAGAIAIGSTSADIASILLGGANNTLANAIVFNTQLGDGGAGNLGIRFGSTGQVLSGAITANSNAAFSGSGTATVSGAISGNGGVIVAATGGTLTLTLSGNNTYLGATAINIGGLVFGKTNSMSASSAVTVATSGTLGANVGGTGEFTSGASGNGTVQGLLAGLGGQAGSTVIWPASGAASLLLDTTNAGGSFTLSTAIANPGTGALGFVKQGTGTLVLTANNTYTGATTITAGTLGLGNSAAIGSTANIVFSGGTLQYSVSNTTDYSPLINSATSAGAVAIDTNGQNVTFATGLSASKSGGLTKAGAGSLTLTANNLFTGNTTVSAGSLVLTGSNNNGATATTTVANGGTLQLQANPPNTAAGVSSVLGTAANKLVIGTTGTMGFQLRSDLATPVTFAGTSGNLGGGPATLNFDVDRLTAGTGTAMTFGSTDGIYVLTDTFNITGNTTGTGSSLAFAPITSANDQTITLNPTTANVSLSNLGGMSINASTGHHNWVLGGTSTGNAVTGVISDKLTNVASGLGSTGGNISLLTKSGTGTWTLSGANTYTGGTTLSGGILALGSSGALATTGNIVFGGGTLQYSASNTTDYSTRINNATSAGAVSIDTSGQDVVFATGFSASKSGGLTKAGAGKLSLLGNNAYTGPTAIASGTLLISGGSSVSGVAVATGATLGVLSEGGILTTTTTSVTFAASNFLADFNSQANPGAALLTTGTLTLNGDVAVSLANMGLITNGTFPLIHYATKSGAGSFTQSSTSIGPRSSAVVSDDGLNDIILTVAADKPKWTGLDNGIWLVGSTGGSGNWKLHTGGTATDYVQAMTCCSTTRRRAPGPSILPLPTCSRHPRFSPPPPTPINSPAAAVSASPAVVP